MLMKIIHFLSLYSEIQKQDQLCPAAQDNISPFNRNPIFLTNLLFLHFQGGPHIFTTCLHSGELTAESHPVNLLVMIP